MQLIIEPPTESLALAGGRGSAQAWEKQSDPEAEPYPADAYEGVTGQDIEERASQLAEESPLGPFTAAGWPRERE